MKEEKNFQRKKYIYFKREFISFRWLRFYVTRKFIIWLCSVHWALVVCVSVHPVHFACNMLANKDNAIAFFVHYFMVLTCAIVEFATRTYLYTRVSGIWYLYIETNISPTRTEYTESADNEIACFRFTISWEENMMWSSSPGTLWRAHCRAQYKGRTMKSKHQTKTSSDFHVDYISPTGKGCEKIMCIAASIKQSCDLSLPLPAAPAPVRDYLIHVRTWNA